MRRTRGDRHDIRQRPHAGRADDHLWRGLIPEEAPVAELAVGVETPSGHGAIGSQRDGVKRARRPVLGQSITQKIR